MEPELQERLASVVGFLETSVQSASQFAIEQAPDVVQQLLAWHFTISLIGFSIAALSLVAVFIGGIVAYRMTFAETGDRSIASLTCIMTLCIGVIPVAVISENMDWLQIWIAPKLYLLEYASSLIK